MKLISSGLCAAVVALGAIATAQTEKPKSTPPQTPPATKPESMPKGAPVAATTEVQVLKLGDVTDLDIMNEANASIGEVDDLIIDANDGRILYALVGKGGVMGMGEEVHVVPWETLHLDAKESRIMGRSKLTLEQITSAPVYKKTDTFNADFEKRARVNAGLGDMSARGGSPSFVMASAVKGADVRSPDNNDLGKIDDIIIAPREGVVAYTILATGGVLGMGEKHFALPWTVTKVSYDKNQKIMVTAPLDKERLAKAPEYEGKDWKRMSSMPWMKDMYGYWTTEPYWSRTVRADSERKIGG